MISVFVTHDLIEFPINRGRTQRHSYSASLLLFTFGDSRDYRKRASHANRLLALSINALIELRGCFAEIDCFPMAFAQRFVQKCTKWLRSCEKKLFSHNHRPFYEWFTFEWELRCCRCVSSEKTMSFLDSLDRFEKSREIAFRSSPQPWLVQSTSSQNTKERV